MKEVIRRGLFETNSSSIHSLTMCGDDEYTKWMNGEMYFDYYNDKLVPTSEELKRLIANNKNYRRRYLTYDDFGDAEYVEYETFEDTYTTAQGEIVHAFGYYG